MIVADDARDIGNLLSAGRGWKNRATIRPGMAEIKLKYARVKQAHLLSVCVLQIAQYRTQLFCTENGQDYSRGMLSRREMPMWIGLIAVAVAVVALVLRQSRPPKDRGVFGYPN